LPIKLGHQSQNARARSPADKASVKSSTRHPANNHERHYNLTCNHAFACGRQGHKDFDFDENDAFALKSDLAQLIPYEIEFNADGTCENTYVSEYKNGKISDDDYTAPCEWSVEGNNIRK